jgi:hypothetical protein
MEKIQHIYPKTNLRKPVLACIERVENCVQYLYGQVKELPQDCKERRVIKADIRKLHIADAKLNDILEMLDD